MASLRRHPKGYPVRFRNPTTGEYTEGEMLDEVWAKAPETFSRIAPKSYGWRQAAFVAQLVKWAGNRRVRITYYVRPERGLWP